MSTLRWHVDEGNDRIDIERLNGGFGWEVLVVGSIG